MSAPIKATAPLTSTGLFLDATGAALQSRIRIKALYVNLANAATSTASNVTLSVGGVNLWAVELPVRVDCGYLYIILPEEGVLAAGPVTGTYAGATSGISTVLFYG